MSVDLFVKFTYYQPMLIKIADTLVYITVAMCVIRGIPVILESKRFLENDKEQV